MSDDMHSYLTIGLGFKNYPKLTPIREGLTRKKKKKG